MKNAQKPEVGMGTKTPKGVVVQISRDHVVVETINGGKSKLSFAQVEKMVGEKS
jgi:hypothetical protein